MRFSARDLTMHQCIPRFMSLASVCSAHIRAVNFTVSMNTLRLTQFWDIVGLIEFPFTRRNFFSRIGSAICRTWRHFIRCSCALVSEWSWFLEIVCRILYDKVLCGWNNTAWYESRCSNIKTKMFVCDMIGIKKRGNRCLVIDYYVSFKIW